MATVDRNSTPVGTDPRDDGRAAATHATRRNTIITIGDSRIGLPPSDQLVFLAGVGLLAAVEIIEWPVAALLAAGHMLAYNHHNRTLREFGEALEEA